MTDQEKIKRLRYLYVVTEKLSNQFFNAFPNGKWSEQDVEKAISHLDEMIGLLPISFASVTPPSSSRSLLLVNPADPADEPVETVVTKKGKVSYKRPDDLLELYEDDLPFELRHKKFLLWNYISNYTKDDILRQKYKPLELDQARTCMAMFPEKDSWQHWEEDMMALYANQIGWYAFLDEEDTGKLEEAFSLLERGFNIYNRQRHKYLEDTKARLLLKMGRPDEAYAIVGAALKRDKNDPDFQDLKSDATYLSWAAKDKRRQKAAEKVFLGQIDIEKQKVTDAFLYPAHPLVVEHTAALNLIKQRMVQIRMEDIRDRQSDNEQITDAYLERFELSKWSPAALEAFEKKSRIRLPDVYKVYLMEVGSGGGGVYFSTDDVPAPDDLPKDEYKAIKRPFPITADKLHNIGHHLGLKAWVYPDDEEWAHTKLFKGRDMETLFGLPEDVEITDGCILLGYSLGQNELFLIANGEFEGEVWSDTLQYGAEALGCFAPASSQRLKLLDFIAESLLVKIVGFNDASEEGDWL